VTKEKLYVRELGCFRKICGKLFCANAFWK